jgi:hypothetical protein
MHWICCLALLATADPTTSFVNGQGVHALKVVEGSLWHSLNAGPFGAVNDETGNRVTGVVAVCGSGFADLDDIHVVAVDRAGRVWHTVRLSTGAWLRWGDVGREIRYAGRAAKVRCASSGRSLAVIITHEHGSETRTVRNADGTWSR